MQIILNIYVASLQQKLFKLYYSRVEVEVINPLYDSSLAVTCMKAALTKLATYTLLSSQFLYNLSVTVTLVV